MARTVIDLDEGALRYAMEELGTTTKVDTVNAALRRVAGERLRLARLRFLQDTPEIGERLEEERNAWR